MLPWLNRKSGGSISGTVKDGQMKDEGTGISAMHAAAQDLMNAIEAKDVAGVADALQAAFELSDSASDEGEI